MQVCQLFTLPHPALQSQASVTLRSCLPALSPLSPRPYPALTLPSPRPHPTLATLSPRPHPALALPPSRPAVSSTRRSMPIPWPLPPATPPQQHLTTTGRLGWQQQQGAGLHGPAAIPSQAATTSRVPLTGQTGRRLPVIRVPPDPGPDPVLTLTLTQGPVLTPFGWMPALPCRSDPILTVAYVQRYCVVR